MKTRMKVDQLRRSTDLMFCADETQGHADVVCKVQRQPKAGSSAGHPCSIVLPMKNCKFNDELILLIRDTRDILQVGMCLGSMLIILVCVVKAVINSCDWWAKYSHSTSVTTRYTMQPLPISLKYEWTKQADRCELVDIRLVDLVIADTYPMV